MKKQVPLAIGIIVGFFAVAEFYIPAHAVGTLQETLLSYGLILAAAAFVLGGINVIQVNWPLIRRREADWPFKIILLVGAGVMMIVGVAWHSFGGEPTNGTVSFGPVARGAETAHVRVHATRDNAMVQIDGGPAVSAWAWQGYKPLQVEVPANKAVKVRVYVPISGYGEFEEQVKVQPGQVATVNTDLTLKWGKEGRVYTWAYDHIFDPCNSTMFALLAFFIASAAFRAFRARNTEATLLLGAAIIVLIGRAPIGRAVWDFLPMLSDWIVDVPNNAGRRAIMMGAALGAIVTGLRVILGIERSHLGADS